MRLGTHLDVTIIQPWREIINSRDRMVSTPNNGLISESVSEINKIGDNNADTDRQNAKQELIDLVDDTRDQLQTASWYVMLDLVRFLQDYLPDVWTIVNNPADPAIDAGTPNGAIVEALRNATFEPEDAILNIASGWSSTQNWSITE